MAETNTMVHDMAIWNYSKTNCTCINWLLLLIIELQIKWSSQRLMKNEKKVDKTHRQIEQALCVLIVILVALLT